MCSRAIIISGGKVVADSPIEELKERFGHELSVKLTVGAKSFDEVAALLKTVPDVDAVNLVKNETAGIAGTIQVLVSVNGTAEIRPALCKKLAEKNVDLYEITLQTNSLEDVFHALTEAK